MHASQASPTHAFKTCCSCALGLRVSLLSLVSPCACVALAACLPQAWFRMPGRPARLPCLS